jgi:putative thiamine transport system ATP-binding protein
MAEPLILKTLTISAGVAPFVSVSLTAAPGEITTLMGPSGSGKSSILAAITGTLPDGLSATGEILLGTQNLSALPAWKRRIGILFQDDLLFPHLSVGGNLALGLAPGGTRSERRGRVEQALAEVGLEGFAARDPATLSGGQKARVALMRVLLSEPRALLLDEPFGSLDAELRSQIRSLVFNHAKARGLPTLLVTHDPQDAEAAGGPVISLR